ncbi:MAG: HAD-IA family hydrolase [Mycobacterium kyogaense]|uniref:HAD-IA family hydrolase n=1 Tax=Mycobacterium kyogaense TaxID=2212479 RepID=UPI002FF6B8AD
MSRRPRYDAVLFDLLTALLDSWTVWNDVAGDSRTGALWRNTYLAITYGQGSYRDYETLVAEAAEACGLDRGLAARLAARWAELQPWSDAPAVLAELASAGVKLGVVTNCSERLGQLAAARLGVPLDVVVTAEAAGAYKPQPAPYSLALQELRLEPHRVLFVAGSRYDIAGAGTLGMPVWWHNRVHMDRGDQPAPMAEHDNLHPLVGDVLRMP